MLAFLQSLGTVPSSSDVWNILVIVGVMTLAKLFSNLGEMVSVHSAGNNKAEILNAQFKSAYTQEDLTNLPDVRRNTIPKLPELRVMEKGVLKLLQNFESSQSSWTRHHLAKITK
jgi:hypothetical protein